jgi:hypothetical protein
LLFENYYNVTLNSAGLDALFPQRPSPSSSSVSQTAQTRQSLSRELRRLADDLTTLADSIMNAGAVNDQSLVPLGDLIAESRSAVGDYIFGSF